MDNVLHKITEVPNTNCIVVSKKMKYFKSDLPENYAKSCYASVSSFADKVEVVMKKLLPDEPLESIRLRGTKNKEIFMIFDPQLDVVVIDRNAGQ